MPKVLISNRAPLIQNDPGSHFHRWPDAHKTSLCCVSSKLGMEPDYGLLFASKNNEKKTPGSKERKVRPIFIADCYILFILDAEAAVKSGAILHVA